MFLGLLAIWFGCKHKELSFPQTIKGKGCYTVCLNCGQEFDFNWHGLEVIRRTKGK